MSNAISADERRAVLEEGNRAYARLRADAGAWAEELAERQLWEATLGDGLVLDDFFE